MKITEKYCLCDMCSKVVEEETNFLNNLKKLDFEIGRFSAPVSTVE